MTTIGTAPIIAHVHARRPDASIVFMHLSSEAGATPSSALPPAPARALFHEVGVHALMQSRGITLERVCLLDPKRRRALAIRRRRRSKRVFVFPFRGTYPFPSLHSLSDALHRVYWVWRNSMHDCHFMLMLDYLGDDTPRDRAAELRVRGFSRRHLDNVQMTTDTGPWCDEACR